MRDMISLQHAVLVTVPQIMMHFAAVFKSEVKLTTLWAFSVVQFLKVWS